MEAGSGSSRISRDLSQKFKPINPLKFDKEEPYRVAVEEILEDVDNYNNSGSGWRFVRVIALNIHLTEFRSLGGSSYIKRPEKIANKKAVINTKNFNVQCFAWCVLRYLNLWEHTQRE